MVKTKNYLPRFPAFFISPVRWSTGISPWIGTRTHQSNVLLISQGITPRDNANLCVRSRGIEPENLIANILRKEISPKHERATAVNNLFRRIASVIVDFVRGGFILFSAADSHKWNAKMRSVIFLHGYCKHRNVSDLSTFRIF